MRSKLKFAHELASSSTLGIAGWNDQVCITGKIDDVVTFRRGWTKVESCDSIGLSGWSQRGTLYDTGLDIPTGPTLYNKIFNPVVNFIKHS